ncbi:MAG: hypothetical protein FJX36_09030 [Alphaproteobacteria bacterium]|nr:hypothetical protein [Alphaproteobacteria bacterium]
MRSFDPEIASRWATRRDPQPAKGSSALPGWAERFALEQVVSAVVYGAGAADLYTLSLPLD